MPKLVGVVKPLARLADLVIVAPTARHAINIEVGHGDGSHSPAFDLWGVRRHAEAQWAPPGGPDGPGAARASAMIANQSFPSPTGTSNLAPRCLADEQMKGKRR